MPNRIIKESACTSDTLAALSADAERLWWRLVVQADDYGRFDGRPAVVLGKCLTAFVERFTAQQVAGWLAELAAAGLIIRYEVDGRPYIQIVTWSRHQRPPRAKESKYPAPPPGASNGPQTEPVCEQTPADVGDGPQTEPLCEQTAAGVSDGPQEHAACEHLTSLDGICRQMTADAPGIRESGSANRDSGGEGGGGHARVRDPETTSAVTGSVHAHNGQPPLGPPTEQPEVEVLPPHTEAELRALQVLRSITGYPFDFATDLDHLRTLAVDFPSLDLLGEVKRFRDYYRGSRPSKKANWRLRLRNWCTKAVEIQRDRAHATRASPGYGRARPEDALDRRLREAGLSD